MYTWCIWLVYIMLYITYGGDFLQIITVTPTVRRPVVIRPVPVPPPFVPPRCSVGSWVSVGTHVKTRQIGVKSELPTGGKCQRASRNQCQNPGGTGPRSRLVSKHFLSGSDFCAWYLFSYSSKTKLNLFSSAGMRTPMCLFGRGVLAWTWLSGVVVLTTICVFVFVAPMSLFRVSGPNVSVLCLGFSPNASVSDFHVLPSTCLFPVGLLIRICIFGVITPMSSLLFVPPLMCPVSSYSFTVSLGFSFWAQSTLWGYGSHSVYTLCFGVPTLIVIFSFIHAYVSCRVWNRATSSLVWGSNPDVSYWGWGSNPKVSYWGWCSNLLISTQFRGTSQKNVMNRNGLVFDWSAYDKTQTMQKKVMKRYNIIIMYTFAI